MNQPSQPPTTSRPDPLDTSRPFPLPGYQKIPAPANAATRPDSLPAGAVYGEAIDGPGSRSSGDPTGSIRTEPKLTPARSAPYEAIARGGLQALGGFLNSRLALRDDPDDMSFIPDVDDEKHVPPPVGRIMARRVPVDISRADLTDLEDMAAAAVTLAAWAIKGLSSMWRARSDRRRAAAGAQAGVYQPGDDGDGD